MQHQRASRRVPICLNPDRFEELRDAERQANEEARKRRYSQEWKEAVTNLEHEGDGLALVTSLLVWPILSNEQRSYVRPDLWRDFVGGIASHLEIELPWNELLDAQTEPQEALKRLREMPPQTLLVFAASLLLGQEAERAIRFTGDTPQLDFVLGREKAVQTEIEDEENDDFDDPRDFEDDYPDLHDDEEEVDESPISESQVVSASVAATAA